MQLPPADRSIAVLFESLPERASYYAELCYEDESPSPQLVFSELAEQAAALLRSGTDEGRLERIFAAVEAVAEAPGVDVVESIAFGFVDGLPADVSARASAYLGPVTEAIAGRLDEGVLDAEADLWALEEADLDDVELDLIDELEALEDADTGYLGNEDDFDDDDEDDDEDEDEETASTASAGTAGGGGPTGAEANPRTSGSGASEPQR